ncbi:LysR family transcriptional regulator [Streptomyces sp. NPDC048659]|uniref:LysR family transcriptional regulator n=1 Tax=Streptomyces sp. NPDC048659 TaxID=3155489 RepID=UPI0034488923
MTCRTGSGTRPRTTGAQRRRQLPLDLRRLRYFVTVAEEPSFVRKARLLHMTQPALSRQIAALEHGLGARLFERDRRGTELTAAGRQLLEDAVPLLDSSAALERRARLAGRGAGRFTVGFMPGVHATPIIRTFCARVPHLTVDVVHPSITDQLPFLVDGRVDVCFVRLPLDNDAFTALPLFPESQSAAAVPASHPLAALPSVEVNDLLDLPLLQDRAEVPRWRGAVADQWPPPGRRRHPTVEEQLERVALGQGTFVLPAGVAGFYQRPDISFLHAADIEPRMAAGLQQASHHAGAGGVRQIGHSHAGRRLILKSSSPHRC